MQIKKIQVYRVELPLHEGSYTWSGGNSVSIFDSTVVAIHTDDGIVGHGEVCPLGPAYLPAYAEGARTGIAKLAPDLVGLDPTELAVLNARMDQLMRGHPYVKSAIDVACWDILGQAAGLPVVTLLGGRIGDSFALYRAISQDTPEAMAASVSHYRAQGYKKFQLKVGGDPDIDISRIRSVASVLIPATSSSRTPTPAGRSTRRYEWSTLSARWTFTSNSPAPAMRSAWWFAAEPRVHSSWMR